MGVWLLGEQLDRMCRTCLALCRRTRTVPMITGQIVLGIYLRCLPEELGAQVRDLASDTDLETLYAVAKFVPRERIAASLILCCGSREGLPRRAGTRLGSS